MNFDFSQKLAMEGGPKAKQTPFASRKRHGDLDKRYLMEVIDSDMLFFYLGTKVRAFERRFAEMYGMKYCIACSSGTAAVHIAVGSLQLPAGSEVITSAITDMGSLTGVLYQGLIPVFADVDPSTLNLDPESVRKRITRRTGAILAVHHSGLAADLDTLLGIGAESGIPVIEDCAQAFGCEYKGELVGRRGAINCFSLNHFKHITCGSGGMVLTGDDQLRYRSSLFLDKCYQREEGIRNPFFLAPNYQITELQGAVALAQLSRVEEFTSLRHKLGTLWKSYLAGMPGISTQTVAPGSKHSYFLALFCLDLNVLSCTAQEFSEALNAEGVPNKAHLITGGRPVYLYDVFQNRSALPGTQYPFVSKDLGSDRRYEPGDCPVAEAAFDRWITMDLHEHFTEKDIEEIALGIGKVAHHYATGKITAMSPGAA
jgi:dTDP-4-amino-4,6-dideoxygalactose transaminase